MNINRRHFILGSAAAAALAGHATEKTGLRQLKPGEKRTMALIGCGIQQRHLASQFLKNDKIKIVATCDCDKVRAKDQANRVNKHYNNNECRVVYDFREIVRDPSIDMVCIATPDHWHAYMCVEAMKHGKDVFCEKPLTWSVQEAREVMAAEKKYGRVFQTGSMQRSWREFRDAVAVVRGGFIGDVLFVDANFGPGDRGGAPSQPVRFWENPANAEKEGAPNPDVDWAMWLGPAAMRPYSDRHSPRGVHHFYPYFWRCDDDLGSGYCGDWGAHHLDIAQWGLDMDRSGPYKVIRSDEPHSTDLYHGGRRLFGVKLVFKKPYGDVVLTHGSFANKWGTVFYGTKGIVAVNRGRIAVWSGTGPVVPTPSIRKEVADCKFMNDKIIAEGGGRSLGAALDKIEKTYNLTNENIAKSGVYVSTDHYRNFYDCVESRKLPITDAETGCRSAILCLLCNMSYKHDVGFDWDPVKNEFANGTGHGVPLRREGDCNGWEVKA